MPEAGTSVKLMELLAPRGGEFAALSREIWDNPELGFEERFALRRQVDKLKELGFSVETPFGGLATAYRAVRGGGNPVFCLAAEYDALPDIGHACGHNLICAAAIAGGWALASLLESSGLEGTVVVMGTPGEEAKGGKVVMLENGALDGVDAVIMAHPLWRTLADGGSNAVRRFRVSFKGKAAHAAGAPELGVNALDAVIMLYNGINAWRQHLPESARVHGIITKGGEAPNIIPDFAESLFYIRSPDDAFINQMEQRFRDIARGAALMTGAELLIEEFGRPYKSRRPNQAMNESFIQAAEHLGMSPQRPQRVGRASSDFGDFSQTIPGIHPFFGICEKEVSLHSREFAQAANSDFAMQSMLKAAAAMATVGYEFISNISFQEQVLKEFSRKI